MRGAGSEPQPSRRAMSGPVSTNLCQIRGVKEGQVCRSGELRQAHTLNPPNHLGRCGDSGGKAHERKKEHNCLSSFHAKYSSKAWAASSWPVCTCSPKRRHGPHAAQVPTWAGGP